MLNPRHALTALRKEQRSWQEQQAINIVKS